MSFSCVVVLETEGDHLGVVACSQLRLFTEGSVTDRGDVKYSHEEKGDFIGFFFSSEKLKQTNEQKQ